MQLSQGKVFEKAEAGSYLGTLIDLVDMPQVKKVIQGIVTIKDMVRVTWTIAYENGQIVYESKPDPQTGARVPLLVSAFYNATVAPKSKLGKAIASILGGQTPVIQTTEQLEQLLLMRSNKLLITKEPDQKNPNDFFNNIVGISPVPPGMTPPPVPQGFIRSKFRPKEQAGPQGQPVSTYSTREGAGPAQNSVSLNAGAAASKVGQPEAF